MDDYRSRILRAGSTGRGHDRVGPLDSGPRTFRLSAWATTVLLKREDLSRLFVSKAARRLQPHGSTSLPSELERVLGSAAGPAKPMPRGWRLDRRQNWVAAGR